MRILWLIILCLTVKCSLACTSFYCLNSCGDYKLIVANNRDEDIYRLTVPADVWPAKIGGEKKNNVKLSSDYIYCDQRGTPPYDLCVFGPLDHAKGVPPKRYSTWLGINERGDVGNILFFMVKGNPNINTNSVGEIAGSYIQDSSWSSPEAFMANLTANKTFYRPFNYVQLAMSKETGQYDLFYVNNNDTESYKKMNPNDRDRFFFSLSNSDPDRAFRKVGLGEKLMSKLVYVYGKGERNKQKLVDSLLYELLQNTTENFPDPNLAAFTKADDQTIRGVSRVNADYGGFWKNAHTRTSTVILVDKYDNVEYHELNLTSWTTGPDNKIADQKWVLNSFKFKLRPSYRSAYSQYPNSSSRLAENMMAILAILFVYLFNH